MNHQDAMNSSVVFARMADDLVKIRTKRFWGGKILGIWFSGGTEGEEEGLSHRQQSVGLFRFTSLSNSSFHSLRLCLSSANSALSTCSLIPYR